MFQKDRDRRTFRHSTRLVRSPLLLGRRIPDSNSYDLGDLMGRKIPDSNSYDLRFRVFNGEEDP